MAKTKTTPETKTAGRFDLTEGGIVQKLLQISLPIIGMQLMQMIYNLADMFWMGKLGTDSLAATSSVGMYLWLSIGFLTLGRMGAEIGVSQSFGSNDRDAAHRYMTNSFMIAAVLGLAVGAAMCFARGGLVGFFNIREDNVVRLAEQYMAISGVGIPFLFTSSVIAGAFTGSGNSRTVFYINVIGIVFNLILDPIMIFALDMQIAGAALSNVAGELLTFVLSLLTLYRHSDRPFHKAVLIARPHIATIRTILKWGLPVMMEALLFPFLSMIITRIVAQWGASAIAAQRIGSQAESLTWLVAAGFCTAVTSFVGQNCGAGKWKRIRRTTRLSVVMLTIYGIAVTALLYFGGGGIMRIFSPDVEVVGKGIQYLRIFSFCQLACCYESLFAGCYRGVGHTVPPSVLSILVNVARVIAAFVVSNTSFGLIGVYWVVSIGAVVRGLSITAGYLLYERKLPRTD